MTIFNHTSN